MGRGSRTCAEGRGLGIGAKPQAAITTYHIPHTTMNDIDFLPDQCRQRHQRRQSQPWRIVVVAAFVALVASAAFSHPQHRKQAEADLELIIPQYDRAVDRQNELSKVQSELKTARDRAELFTYIRHPWPRTQLLAVLIDPLPEEVTLNQLQITREIPQNRGSSKQRRGKKQADIKDDEKSLPPAAADLKRLQDEFDDTITVVLISGTTDNSVALHRYLGTLDDSVLFAKAELESSETIDDNNARAEEFQVKLIVRPGYGQKGGPTGDDVEEKP